MPARKKVVRRRRVGRRVKGKGRAAKPAQRATENPQLAFKGTVPEKPWMTTPEIKFMLDLLHGIRPETVLEWGCGGSTLFYPKHCPFIKRWVSIESNPEWLRAVRKLAPKNVEVYHGGGVCEYIHLADKVEAPVPFILVDGVHRGACMGRAAEIVTPGSGRVVLHDSGRLAYKPFYTFFDHSREVLPGNFPRPYGGCGGQGLTVCWND